MLKNYLKIALRNLRQHPGYSLINVVGLAVGLSCCLLIFLYVQEELSFDRFHEEAGRVYRVQQDELAVTPTIVAPLFKRQFPEVVEAARLYDVGSFRPPVVRYGERAYQEEGFFYADSTIFEVFTLPFLGGNPETALTRPTTVVITASMADKYFPGEDPVGKALAVGSDRKYEVTGVIEDLPSNSHVQFDFLASFATTYWAEEEIWSSANFLTYVLLRDAKAADALRAKIDEALAQARAAGQVGNSFDLELVPLTRIHLDYEGRRAYVYLFSAIALLILLVACVNYMNLATARAGRRAREVGVRKSVGAHRGQLVRQFYGESVLLAVLALLLSLLLAYLALPVFNALSGKAFAAPDLVEPKVLLALAGIGGVVSVVAGSYPALVLSGFEPVEVLKGGFSGGQRGGGFRKGLVAFQFAVSVFLLVATAVVYSQLRYVQTTNLGFDKEQVVVLPLSDSRLHEVRERLEAELERQPRVQSVSAVNRVPGYQESGYALTIEGLELPEGDYFPIGGVPAYGDVVETLGLELVAGPGFPEAEGYTPEPGSYVYLVNEETVRQLGWTPEEAVGRRMSLSGENRMGTLVGVIEDYHFLSLHEPIQPMAYFIEPGSTNKLLVRVAPDDVQGVLAEIRAVWERFAAHRPFEYAFLDQQLDALYRAEQQTGQLFAAFAVLAVFIACLGLLGLAAFAAERRTKEIGIRKVLGASVASIVVLLSKDFLKLVLVAFVVAAPVAFLAMQRWLESFAYRIELSPWIFAGAGATVLAIALLIVSYQAVRAALADPVKSLRYE